MTHVARTKLYELINTFHRKLRGSFFAARTVVPNDYEWYYMAVFPRAKRQAIKDRGDGERLLRTEAFKSRRFRSHVRNESSRVAQRRFREAK